MRNKLLCGLFLGILTTQAFGIGTASAGPVASQESLPTSLSLVPRLAAVKESKAEADPVKAMSDPIYLRATPDATTLVTPFPSEAEEAAQSYGYTNDLGTPFTASMNPAPGLSAVHRLWNPQTGSFMSALADSQVLNSAVANGYTDQGTFFYALAEGVEGRTIPIYNYVKNGKYRPANAETGKAMIAKGWERKDVVFYVPGSPDDGSNAANQTNGEPGSVPVGSARYRIPEGAVFVSPSGDDSNSGQQDSPFKTISHAVKVGPTNGTVVVRGGTYRETVTMYKTMTIQNSPGEAVWLDGSIRMNDGWVKSGDAWRKDNWVETNFDNSPTYTRGAPDGTTEFWTFINPKHPMAANPEQVYINDVALTQVASREDVKAGTFYVDRRGHDLYLGTNPNGQKVDVSSRIRALEVRADNTVIRGIGVRRYSPSVPDIASVTLENPGAKMENVVIENASTTGLGVMKENVVLNQVTVKGSGMLGIHGKNADNLKMSKMLVTRNNSEHFNWAPVAGGMKVGKSRKISVVDSSFVNNYGHGMWEDLSDCDSLIRRSKFSNNEGTGLFLELSAKAIVGNNIFANNGEFGMKVNNTRDVQIWNNTFVGNSRPVNLVQDDRRNNDPNDPAVDDRIHWPDPEVTWTLGDITVKNNVISKNPSGNCLLCVEDYSQKKTGEQMNIKLNSNLYHRTSPSEPTWLAIWSRGPKNPGVFTTLKDYTAATGQESRGLEYIRDAVVGDDFRLSDDLVGVANDAATAVPDEIADAIEIDRGTKVMGAILNP